MSAINTVYITVNTGAERIIDPETVLSIPCKRPRREPGEMSVAAEPRPRHDPGESSSSNTSPVYICSQIVISGRSCNDNFFVEPSEIDVDTRGLHGRRGRCALHYGIVRCFVAHHPLLRDLHNPVIKLVSTGSMSRGNTFRYINKVYDIIGDYYSFEIQFV